MAGLHLVTGFKGSAHVTSADQGVLNAMSIGTGDYVFTKGRRFEAEIRPDGNTVRIYGGSLMMNGRQVNLDAGSYIDVPLDDGVEGMNRHDVIAVCYEINTDTEIESADLIIIKGTASNGTVEDPEVTNRISILEGATRYVMPLYRVVIEDFTIINVEPLFQVLAPMADIQHGFYKQNMLINGDFQCNHRGAKTYEATGTTEAKYSVDMWRIHQLKLEKLNEGVRVTGNNATGVGYFTQFIDLGALSLPTSPYTISANVDGKIYTFTATPSGDTQEKDFGKFKISVITTSTWEDDLSAYHNRVKVSICPIGTNSFVIKYVDVFEGTVAYPHVKEDPATAMMRCRRYVQRGCQQCPIIQEEVNSSNKCLYRFGIPFDNMVKTPSVVACSWAYTADDTTVSGDLTKVFAVTSRADGLIELKHNTYNTPMGAKYHTIRATYVLSCEHAPNGD